MALATHGHPLAMPLTKLRNLTLWIVYWMTSNVAAVVGGAAEVNRCACNVTEAT